MTDLFTMRCHNFILKIKNFIKINNIKVTEKVLITKYRRTQNVQKNLTASGASAKENLYNRCEFCEKPGHIVNDCFTMKLVKKMIGKKQFSDLLCEAQKENPKCITQLNNDLRNSSYYMPSHLSKDGLSPLRKQQHPPFLVDSGATTHITNSTHGLLDTLLPP